MPKKFVSAKDESPDMFSNSVLNYLTRVHWSVPLFIFLPVVFYFLYQSFFVLNLSFFKISLGIIGGFIIWTITEYLLHRFIFHSKLPGKLGQRIHFIFHGVHHDYPNDSLRLVMVPTVSVPLAFLFYYIFKIIFGVVLAAPFFAGFVIGYLIYDMMHYAIHHIHSIKHPLWKAIKEHHMVHHFQDDKNGFGVSSVFWDYVFGTQFSKRKKE